MKPGLVIYSVCCHVHLKSNFNIVLSEKQVLRLGSYVICCLFSSNSISSYKSDCSAVPYSYASDLSALQIPQCQLHHDIACSDITDFL